MLRTFDWVLLIRIAELELWGEIDLRYFHSMFFAVAVICLRRCLAFTSGSSCVQKMHDNIILPAPKAPILSKDTQKYVADQRQKVLWPFNTVRNMWLTRTRGSHEN